ncbi:hypothetical protein Leryth_013607 [Lithospermum erythrorhizon]|nr:hypothetical protein Leryth_013607 [Lithospermum erythrorhizon]
MTPLQEWEPTCNLKHISRGIAPENGHHEDSSSPWSGLRDRYSGHDKAKVKETILEHEVIFRHQVQELHRLYRRQRELTNAVQENRLCNSQKKSELSHSVIVPSFMTSAKRTQDASPFRSSDTMIGRLDPSTYIAGQSNSTVLKRKNCQSLNPCRDMYLDKPANLCISGSGNMNKEKTTVEGLSFGLDGNGVGCEEGRKEPLQERASNSFFDSAAKYHIIGGHAESNERLNGRICLGYLNEPFQFLRSISSVKSSCHTDTLQRRDLTANINHLQVMTATGKSRRVMVSSSVLFFFSCNSTDLSLDIDHKTEGRKKRKIFGVEIAEVDESPLVSSYANNSYPKSNAAESNTSPFLSVRASTRHLNRKVSSPQGNHGVTTSEPSWLKLGSCLQNLEFVRGTDARDALKSSVPKNDLFHTSSLCVHPQRNPKLIDGGAVASLDILNGNHDFTSLPDLFEFHDSSTCWKRVNSEQMKSRRILKFDSEITNMSESGSQHFFNIPGRAEIPSKELNLEKSIKDTEDKKDGHAIEKSVGFPSTEMVTKNDVVDHPTDFLDKKSPIQHIANPNDAGKSMSKFISGLRNHIDLNLSIVEEETPATVGPLAVMKSIRPEIGLEVATVTESEEVEHGGPKSLDKSGEPHEILIEEAAEALVVISSALTNNVANYATCHLEATSNCLHWFADVICSYTSDEAGGIRKISEGQDGCCDEKSVPDGMDYFEFMTLQLKGAKEETQCYNHSDMEQQKAEETEISVTKRRFGRGHGRRRRQQKDFQKDVLPDLVSLAKQEVVEDLQTLEELFRSTGKTWKSSLSRRNGAKNGRRGITSGDCINTSEANSAPLPTKQKQNGGELQLRGKHFTGWGKRTRRLPRKRCSKKSCSSIQLSTSV